MLLDRGASDNRRPGGRDHEIPRRPLRPKSIRHVRRSHQRRAGRSPASEFGMHNSASSADGADHDYRRRLRELQIELVKFQRDLIKRGDRILVVIEGEGLG